MSDGLPDQVEEGPNKFPVAIRRELNKNSKMWSRPWEVKLAPNNKNRIHVTAEKIVLELSSVRVTWCKNGTPTAYDIVGKQSQIQ